MALALALNEEARCTQRGHAGLTQKSVIGGKDLPGTGLERQQGSSSTSVCSEGKDFRESRMGRAIGPDGRRRERPGRTGRSSGRPAPKVSPGWQQDCGQARSLVSEAWLCLLLAV